MAFAMAFFFCIEICYPILYNKRKSLSEVLYEISDENAPGDGEMLFG